MKDAFVFAAVNINVAVMFRMIQRRSPFSIKMDKIRAHEKPFGMSIFGLKVSFFLLALYIGLPLSTTKNNYTYLIYGFYWFCATLWWSYFSQCSLQKSMYISCSMVILSLILMELNVLWMPTLWWACYVLYISIWYKRNYQTSLILS